MCLAVPARVIDLGPPGRVDIAGNVRECFLDLVPGVSEGDYVLIHAGIAIETIRPEDALETFRLLEEAYGDGFETAPGRDVEGVSRSDTGPEDDPGSEGTRR